MTADNRPGAADPRVRTILQDALAAVRDPAAWLQHDEALAPDNTPLPAPWTEARRLCASTALRRAAELRLDSDPDPDSGTAWSDALQHAMALVLAAAGRLPEPDRDTDPDFTGLVDQLDAILASFNDEASHEDILLALETAVRNAT